MAIRVPQDPRPDDNNKWWERPIFIRIALFALFVLGGVLGGFIGWTIHPEPSPIVSITPDPAKTQLELEAPSRLADGSHRTLFKITVRDQSEKPLPNVPVQVTSTPKTDMFPATASTNQEGVALFSATYRQAGKRTITVQSNGIQLVQRDIDFPEVQLPVQEVQVIREPPVREPPVTVDLVEATLQEDNRLRAELRLTIRNEANTQVQVTSNRRSDTLPATIRTDAQGQATGILTSNEPGQRTITVRRNGKLLGQDDVTLPAIRTRVVEVEPRPAPVTVQLVSTSSEADDRLRADLELTVRNPDGTVLANQTVQVTTDLKSNPMTVRTDRQGKATVSLTYAQPEKRTIAVKRDSREVGQVEIFLPEVQPHTQVETRTVKEPIVVPPPVTVKVVRASLQDDNRLHADLELTVRNPDGTALANQTVQVTTDPQSKPTTARTDGEGKVTLSLAYTQPENRTIVVKQDGVEVGQAVIFLPEFQPRTVEKTIEKTPLQHPKRLVRLKVEGSDNVQLTDAIVKMNGKPVKANTDGVFETEVEENQNAIEVEVKRDGYETPQGDRTYKKSLPLVGVGAQVVYYFYTITLDPVRYYVELPPAEELKKLGVPDDLNSVKVPIKFIVRSSPSDPPSQAVEADLTSDRSGLLFPYDSRLELNQKSRIHVAIQKGSQTINLGTLPFRAYR